MPVIIDEHTQYMNEGGKPLVNGKIFIGVVNQDPKLNPEPIFADPALTTPLPNPQALDSFGRTVNKMYVAGRYSFKLEDSNGGQIVQDLDRGSVPAVGITVLTNIQGTNAITAQANPIISNYVDKEQFSLTIINSPTGATTLNIDGLGAIPIRKNGLEIQPNQLLADQLLVVAFNIIGPVFELISGTKNLAEPLDTNNFSINESQGASVASAIQPNIWAGDGNTLHITGTNQIDDFTDAPRIGAKVTLIFDDVLILKNGLGITLQGGADIVTKAGDRIEVYADAVDAFSGVYFRLNVPPSAFATQLFHAQDQKANNTVGGTLTSGTYQTRDLNVVIINQIVGADLTSNQVKLPPGIYFVEALAVANSVDEHKTKLRDITSGVDLVLGFAGFANAAVQTMHTLALLDGNFTLSIESFIELQHRCGTTRLNVGRGVQANFGDNEIYAEVKIWKVG